LSVPVACAHGIETEFGLDASGLGAGGQAGTLPSTTLGGSSGSGGASGASSTEATGGAGTIGTGGSSSGGASGNGGGGSTGGAGSSGSGGLAGTGGQGGMDAGGSGGTTVRDAGPPITVDDSLAGTAQNQFNYGAGWNHCNPCTSTSSPPLYMTSNSWAGGTDAGTNESVTFAFTGTQLVFYGVKDPRNGIGAVSIDGGAETMIDFYASARAGDQAMWTSPVLAAAAHTFRLRATRTKSASSTGTTVTVDRVDVFR